MPEGKYTAADVAPAQPAKQGRYSAADVANAPASNMEMTPADLGIKNPIPVSTPVPHQVDKIGGLARGGSVYLPPVSKSLPGSFEGKPENTGQYIQNGPGAVAKGGIDIARGNFAKGGHEVISGVGETTLPVAALTAPATAPAVLARGVAGGVAGSYAGGKLANLFGATTDQQDLVSDLGGIAGGFAGTDLLPKVGEAMQGTGAGIINRTVGLRKGDYARNANPGLAYFDGGNGPSLNMRSIADKAEATNADSGTQLGAAYNAASAPGNPLIPPSRVESALRPPIDKGIAIANGPGGNPAQATQYQDYFDTFKPTLSSATSKGGFTPSELFDVKKNIAANTNWRDQQQFNINKVRQQNTGAVGEVLTDAVPETKPLNAIYQGSRILADRATERANTGSMPLTNLFKKGAYTAAGAAIGHAMPHANAELITAPLALAGDSTLARTLFATGLYKGGGVMKAGGGIRNLFKP